MDEWNAFACSYEYGFDYGFGYSNIKGPHKQSLIVLYKFYLR